MSNATPDDVKEAVLDQLRDHRGEWMTPSQIGGLLRSSSQVAAHYAARAHERNADEEPSDAGAKSRDGYRYLAWEALNDLSTDAGAPVERRIADDGNLPSFEFRVDRRGEDHPETMSGEDDEVLGGDELAANLPAVFKRQDAPIPEIYEDAKRAIQTCERVVKVKKYERSARALEELGRMAEDHEIIHAARRLRLYAVRKAGEILREYKRDPEKNLPQHRRDGGGPTSGGDHPTTQREAAEEAGFSKHQEVQARRVAQVLAEEFVKAAESDDPPSVTAMAERGMKSRGDASQESGGEDRRPEPTSRESAAETLREALDRWAWWCRVQDAAELRAEFEEEEHTEAAENVEKIVPWLRHFCALDGEVDPHHRDSQEPAANAGPPDEEPEVDRTTPSEPEDTESATAEMDRVLAELEAPSAAERNKVTDENGADDESGCSNCSAPTRPGEKLCAHCSAHGLGGEEAS